MNYWQNRSFEITKEIFTDSESYVKFIHNEYEKAIAELDGRILNHLNAMSSEQGVSLAEANKLLSQAERMDLQEFINKAKGKITPDIEKSLNLASRRVRISRLQAMELEIKTSVSKLLNTEEKRLFAHLTNTFNKKYYNELYGLQRITGYENIFKINDDELRQIILNPWASDGSNFSNRIWKRRDKLVGTLRANLTRNIIAGRSNDDIIKNISSAMNVSKANAGRLVMTESAAMNSIATQKAYNRMKTEKYEILATLDLKTSDICQDMDSKVFDVKDYSVGITAPPFHPNCRTTTIPYFDDDLGLEDTRVARNIDTGKNEKVPDMSYKTWYDKYVVDKNDNSGYNKNRENADYISNKLIEKFKGIEPNITSTLKYISSITNGKMEGLDFRLKSVDSLSRKITMDAKEKGVTLKEASKEIKDILRYTIVYNENEFTNSYFNAIENLKDKGYNVVRIKNSFKDNQVYKGLNTLIKDKDGNIFELQFHTPMSIDIKEGGLHELYEKQRLLDIRVDREKYNKLKMEMIKLSDKIKNPLNVEKIKDVILNG
ncbi:hypothetical protein HMPREF9629_00635 [Peptoanaerobacter stomatis]|uniref:Phage head morphogenesis domain-containing protein n=1 Tax=Peptoanaerobacter stomatis TaxID=796937 RepID=G9X2M8_9FIRM|nr:minor capsid protein [Peptoanaerobacter stomatis]EHL11098.1 hypothetical protein HMPREF9629_00635 [Peptoanaerobacter stomatis]